MSGEGTGRVVAAVDPWASVVGQERAVGQLQAAAQRPAHAYLFVGPPGSGRRAAARTFAGELFATADPSGARRHRSLAATEQHPDLTVVERRGASIPVGDRENPEEGSARWVAQRAALSPVEGGYSVFVLLDFHLVRDAAPVLLKTLEEPPAQTVFVVVADEITPELVTIASRCVRVEFHGISREVLIAALVAEGADPTAAEAAAAGALGSMDRARLLINDPRYSLRRDTWAAVPERLDGTGATAAVVAAEMVALLDDAQAPLDEWHRREIDELATRVEVTGERGSGRREMDARHRREARRLRTDELRFGFTVLAERYRDRMVTGRDQAASIGAIRALLDAAESLERNPNEALMLQALMVRLGRAG